MFQNAVLRKLCILGRRTESVAIKRLYCNQKLNTSAEDSMKVVRKCYSTVQRKGAKGFELANIIGP